MITRIKYKIKKIRIKIFLLIKNELENEEVLQLPINKRKRVYVKKILFNPKRTFFNLTGKVFNVKYTEIVLTTVCTLKCKGCSALMREYKNPCHTDLENNIKALERMLEAVDSIRLFRLLGGEPLCYPNLYEMLLFISKQNKIKHASIVTNGTLLIKDERIIELLKNKRFSVFISNYGEISNKKNELINQLKSNNIKYILSNEEKLWRDYGDLEYRNRNKKSLKKQFLNCEIMCNSIFEGKLHHCPRSTHGMNLNKIPVPKKDYVDLLDKNLTIKQLRIELYKFFYKYVPYVEACDYCNGGTNEIKKIPAGMQ